MHKMDGAPFPGTASPFTMRGGPLFPSTALFAGTGAVVGGRWCSQQVIFLDPFSVWVMGNRQGGGTPSGSPGKQALGP